MRRLRGEEFARRQNFHRKKLPHLTRRARIAAIIRPSRVRTTMARGLLLAQQHPRNAPMQIPSASSYFGPTSSKATSSTSAAGATNAEPVSGKSKLASKGNDVVQQFLDYAKMDPIQRMRAGILKSMGLTEDDLKNMSPEQQKAVEQKIEQLIQEQLKKNAGKTGQVVDVSA
jgi:hypothetical protein